MTAPPACRRPGVPVAIGAVIIAFFIQTWMNTQHTRTEGRIATLVEKRTELRKRKEKLEVEKSRLEAPARIRQIATRKLGYRMPGPEQIVEMP